MPIYEYQCATCEVRFDRMRPMSQADEPAQCPRCGALVARCASTFASRGSNGKMSSGSSGVGCSGCAGSSCATCGGH
jgi:putative FmdB family regulatory protein